MKSEVHDCTPLVTIHCIAYNQERFIRRTLEGFVMQQTDFPFIAVVHDDASTDNTAHIIREFAARYPRIIKPVIEKENQYSKPDGSLERIMASHMQGRYVAYCEGDDYWTDPHKLQKQVDYLEANPGCSMHFTNVQVLDEATGTLSPWVHAGAPEIIDTATELHRNRVMTPTVMIRHSVLKEYDSTIGPLYHGFMMGDYTRWLFATTRGYIYHSSEVTGVYRVLGESGCHTANPYKKFLFRLAIYDARITFCRYFGIPGARKERLKRAFRIVTTCTRHGWWKGISYFLRHPGYTWNPPRPDGE